MAIKSFADHTTSDVYHGIDSKAARQVAKVVWPAAQRRMTMLHTAKSTLDLSRLPGSQFKPLKYDRPGFFSMRISEIYRLIFRFENGDAYEVSIENYHGRKTS